MAMSVLLIMSFGTSMQAYAAGDAYSYDLIERVKSKNTINKKDNKIYSSIEGLALGDKDGMAYVLKVNKEKTKDKGIVETCLLFGGKRKNLQQQNKNGIEGLGHANDMTYRRNDKKLYVATREQKIVRMNTDGTNRIDIKTKYEVGSIACWFNYNKQTGEDAFVLKDTKGKFHIVHITGTKVIELYQFNVNQKKGELNQGICMYQGYLYVTSWDKVSGNSYVYKVDKPMSTIAKEKGKEGESENNTYKKTRLVTLDKKKLANIDGMSKTEAEKVSKKLLKMEIESIAFAGGYLYFTANVNYKTSKGTESLDGLYKVNKQLV